MGQSNAVQHRRWTLALLTLAGGAISFVLASTGGITAATICGVIAVLVCLLVARELTRHAESALPRDPGRRRLLAVVGGAGMALVAGGGILGRVVRRATRPDPSPILDSMAEDLGAEVLELVRRAYHPGRSGDMQLVLTPGSTANYPPESTSLVKRDPRSSHALPWMYLERVPVVVYAPGVVDALDDIECVTLADLTPTAARLMGFDGFEAVDGRALPGNTKPMTPPRVIVTFVIDGGGWNVLSTWAARGRTCDGSWAPARVPQRDHGLVPGRDGVCPRHDRHRSVPEDTWHQRTQHPRRRDGPQGVWGGGARRSVRHPRADARRPLERGNGESCVGRRDRIPGVASRHARARWTAARRQARCGVLERRRQPVATPQSRAVPAAEGRSAP